MIIKKIYNEFRLERLAVTPSQVIAASGAPNSIIQPTNITVETFDDYDPFDVEFDDVIL